MSIVLVILGLLVGGVLAGKSLIRASEMRSVATEYSKYYSAIQSFKQKYFYLPGDMPNATQFWGALGTPSNGLACESVWKSDASSSIATCDGNGNGQIDAAGSVVQEDLKQWQHLANGGLIEGKIYHGARDIGHFGCPYVPGNTIITSCPKAKIGQFWNSAYLSTTTVASDINTPIKRAFAVEYGNAFYMWFPLSRDYGLSAIEAWNIDTKMDDGKPGMGKMVIYGYLQVCTTTIDPTQVSADYLIDANSIYRRYRRCTFFFRNQF